MNRSTLARRYAPLAAVVAIQLLIIATVPSKAPTASEVAAGGGGAAVDESFLGQGDGGMTVDPVTGEVLEGATAGGASSGSAVTSSGTRASGGTGTAAGGGATSATGAIRGDTKHCRDGRQFDTTYYAPPCIPKFVGDNLGATYQGVTKDSILVVRYNGKPNAAVDALLNSVDLSSSDEDELAFEAAAETYVNARFEFYGRKIDFKTFDGQCSTVPPAYDCLRNEMRKIAIEMKPFFVFWNTPLASAAYDELSGLKIPNAGGWHFDDAFSIQREPYHYDTVNSGTNIAKFLSEYWCKRLAGRPAKYSGDPGMKLQTRRLGIITPNDPANQRVLAELEALTKNCGGGVVATYSYSQDIDRANEQRNAGVQRMIDNKVTTIMCVCDGIAPYFLVLTCDEKNYHPEHIVPGTGAMDFDAVGRLYMNTTQWQRAFGISILGEPEPYSGNDAARVWRGSGRTGQPYNTALGNWRYYELIASLVQMAGPNLTPASLQAGALRLGPRGGVAPNELRAMAQNNWSWMQDIREVYWSSTTPSKLDGKPGSYISVNGGKRYRHGQLPNDEPRLPLAGNPG